MKTYLIVNASPNPEEQEELQKYTSQVVPMLEAAGGEHLKRLKLDTAITGEADYHLLLFMEFPGEESVRSVFDSEAYKALIPHRDKGFHQIKILLFKDLY